jgi:ligand-binding sensor domain-containing protein/DNA-binding CsgD family transcriptional regulator
MTKRAALPLISFLFAVDLCLAADALPGRFHRFERLTPKAGAAPVTGFSSICQDSEGFLWLGTGAGLARFDGFRFTVHTPPSDGQAPSPPAAIYPVTIARSGDIWAGTNGQGLLMYSKGTWTFVQYRHDERDPRSLSDDIVLAVQEDAKGDFWIGTRSHGLVRFDRATRSFMPFPLGPGANVVWDVMADRTGGIWVGTLEAGLFRIDPATGAVVNFRNAAGDPRSLGGDNVWTLFEDHEGTIWVGTKNGGLNRFDPADGGFTRFYGAGSFPRDLAKQTITAVAADGAGRLWIGTASEGVRVWDKASGEYSIYRNDPQDAESLGDDSVTSIFTDAGGVVWVGTVRGGLNKCLAGLAKFEHYKRNAANPRSLLENDVRALWTDGAGALWVGLKPGLARLEARTGASRRFLESPSGADAQGENNVLAVLGDSWGMIWLGTEAGGLARLDPRTGEIARRRHDPRDPNSLSNDKVNALWPDPERPGVLWVGTHQGLNRYDTRADRWTRYLNDPRDPNSLSGNIITALHGDKAGSLWVGTSWGLNRMDRSTGACERFVAHLEDPPGANINDNIVHCILAGSDGVLWVGTERGLNRYDPARREWRSFAPKDGLAGDVICGILEDAAGRFWISTNRGLSRLDPGSGVFRNFGLSDGLQGRAFNPGTFCASADGRMAFGGTNGFNRFDPAAVKDDPFVPPIAWTAFRLNNKDIEIPRSLSGPPVVTLPYRTPLAAFEFAALSFAAPELNTLVYRLEPRDGDWVPVDPYNSVTLSGLGAGGYSLRVKAANPDGVWNETGVDIAIRVPPPFWRTWWFLLIGGAILVSGIVSAVRLRKRIRSSPLVAVEDQERVIGAYDLTAREREILRLVLQGASNKDIEKKLFISGSTVRNHIYNVYQKLGVRNRLELINRIARDTRDQR